SKSHKNPNRRVSQVAQASSRRSHPSSRPPNRLCLENSVLHALWHSHSWLCSVTNVNHTLLRNLYPGTQHISAHSKSAQQLREGIARWIADKTRCCFSGHRHECLCYCRQSLLPASFSRF